MVMLLMTGLLQQVYAQDRSLSGRVTDRASGQGLPGATVLVKGTTIGASTNADGSFSLSVPSSATTLSISSIGYASIDQPIGSNTTFNVSLASDIKTLGEVVVTGALGVQRQSREIGYATATLDTKEINQARVTNVTNGLAGKVSGLQIQTLSNGINPSVRVTLRGSRSATGENQALIVVDGVLSTSEVLTALNPDDIDNITVLKGANAAALYGSQASNGALIITTKKGGTTPSVTFSHTSQFESISFLPKLQNEFGLGAQEYAENYPVFPVAGEDSTSLDYESQYNNMENQQYGPRFDGRVVRLGLGLENGLQQYTTYDSKPNERRNFFNTGYQMQNNVSFSGGDDKSKIFVSFQNVKNNGIVPKDEYNRNAFRLNASRDFGKLTVGFNTSYARKSVDATSNLSAANSVYYSIINTSSMVPITKYKDWQNDPFANPNGYYNNYYQNPYFVLDNNRTHLKENYFVGDVNLGYKVFDWLSLQYRFGATLVNQANQNTRDRFQYSSYVTTNFQRNASSTSGYVQESTTDYTRLNSDFFINMDKTFGDFTAKLILGNNTQSGTSNFLSASSTGLANAGLFNLTNRIGQIQGSQRRYVYHQTSLFADATVGYKEFIFLHASGRNDWSSILLKANRSFFYPSVDLSVIFTEAIPVLKEASYIDYGKIRGGIAKVGQINLGGTGVGGDFGSARLNTPYNLGAGFPIGPLTSFSYTNQTIAPNLKPEFTTSIEAGIELSFLKRRVSTSATYYKQNTTDQTLSSNISIASGFSGFLLNAGEIQNNGVELDLNLVPVRLGNGLEWRIGANYNYNDSKVLSLAPNVDEVALTTGGNANVYAVVGQPFPILRGSYYVRDDQGRVIVDKTNDPNGNDVYFPRKSTDLKILGNTLPKHKYGFNTSLSYKGITLAAQAEYRTGYVVYNSIGEDLDFTGASQRSVQYGRQPFIFPNSSVLGPDGVTYVANTEKLTPGGAEFWASDTYNRSTAENYVTSGKFFKIRELSLSYNLPTSMLSGARFIKGVGLNVFARNLYTWVPKENQYTDPEFNFGNSNGVGINSVLQTPPTKFYGATLSANF
jgi:TonB-linked SusC/RagA family outer membrane protein